MFSELLNRAGRTALTAVAALALLFWAGDAQAQQGAITGQVVDASNLEPVVGAQVFIPGTDYGGLTNEEGRYRITGVPSGQHQVRVRLLGYRPTSKTVTVEGGETATLNFQLSVSAVALEEVVVTATGERRQREVGSAISTVDAASAVEQSSPTNLTNLLKGRSTGVSVQRSGGTVGSGDVIKIRGNTSIGLSNVPLIYIDGARVDNDNSSGPAVGGQNSSRLNDLNPEDIESIEIVKGPSAAALYGTEAAAGVIRIETKSGSSSGDTRYNFRVESGVNREYTDNFPNSYHDNVAIFGEEVDVGALLLGAPGALGPPVATKDTLYSMNLMEPQFRPSPELAPGYANPFRDGYVQTYGGSIRGGSEFATYYLSGEFNAEDGNLPNNHFDKYNLRGNFNLSPSDKLDISISNGFTSNFLALPDNDNNGFGYIGIAQLGLPFNTPFVGQDFVDIGTALTCPLNFEVARFANLAGISELLISDGQSFLQQLGGCGPPGLSGRTFDDIASLQNRQHVERYTGSATGTYRPWDFMTNRVTIGYDEISNDEPQLVPVDPDRPFGTFSQGAKFTFQEEKRNLTLEATSTLNFDLTENLNSQTTLGGQWFKEIEEGTFSDGQTLPPGCTTVSCAVTTSGGETFSEERTLGVFVQEQLSWQDRVFLTPAVRFDDNSAFGENLDVQTLPSVSFSWIMSEEEWFPGLFDQFRLRGAWGKAGLQPGPTDALNLLNQVSVTLQGQSLPGLSVTDPGNPQLAPETTTEWEGGFDASLLDGRLSLKATYYHQTTEDAIVFQDLQPSFGFPGARPTNVGEITSQGFEFGVDATAVDVNNFTWDWGLNLSTNDGEITQLADQIVFGLGGASQRHREGRPFAGYYSSRFEVVGDTATCFGDVRGCQGDSDVEFLGHPTPEWEGSVSTTFTLFDRLSLHGLVDFAGGHHLFNATEEFLCGFASLNACGTIHERNDTGRLTDEALIKRKAVEVGEETPWIEKADYAKLRTVSLRFELPESWVQPIRASGASLSVVGENLATFTGYSGLDPEINFGGTSEATRAEFLTLPTAQRFVATLSLTF